MNIIDVVKTLNTVQVLLNWLTARSAHHSEIIALLNTAHAENRDITTEDVQNNLDIVLDELDATQKLIDEST